MEGDQDVMWCEQRRGCMYSAEAVDLIRAQISLTHCTSHLPLLAPTSIMLS
jgi:hypothetical protein